MPAQSSNAFSSLTYTLPSPPQQQSWHIGSTPGPDKALLIKHTENSSFH